MDAMKSELGKFASTELWQDLQSSIEKIVKDSLEKLATEIENLNKNLQKKETIIAEKTQIIDNQTKELEQKDLRLK